MFLLYFLYSIRMRVIKRIPTTKSGYETLLKKLQDILQMRPEAVKTLKAARELGDLSENGLYKGARARLSSLDANIRRLRYQIKLADIIIPKTFERVSVGTTVVVSDGGIEKKYNIVGNYEADPLKNNISTGSPIGFALFGRKKGDRVEIKTPGGKRTLKIISIS